MILPGSMRNAQTNTGEQPIAHMPLEDKWGQKFEICNLASANRVQFPHRSHNSAPAIARRTGQRIIRIAKAGLTIDRAGQGFGPPAPSMRCFAVHSNPCPWPGVLTAFSSRSLLDRSASRWSGFDKFPWEPWSSPRNCSEQAIRSKALPTNGT